MDSRIKKLVEDKDRIGDERDLCAELYNLWITRLYEQQDDPERYEMYVGLIAFMEPYGNKLKEDMREINREICKIQGVDSIGDTDYVRECNNAHGLDKPNA
jgi:hypothetical protein